jgi:trans-aconitate methyltransferase
MDSKKHFDEIANFYKELRPVYTPLMDKLAEVLELKQGDVVVDYGCGPGQDLKYLIDKYNIKPIGIDSSNVMCRLSAEKIGAENVINENNQHSVKNIYFNKIYFKFVMHHIFQPHQFIDDIIGYMKSGSAFAIITMLPENVSSYIVLRYFSVLRTILEEAAQKQFEIVKHIQSNSLVDFYILENIVSEEIFDESLIEKINKNYSSFISTMSEQEKNDGIQKIKNEINVNYKFKHLTKGVICYGRKY